MSSWLQILIFLLPAAIGVGGRRAGVLPGPIHPSWTSYGRVPRARAGHRGAKLTSSATYHSRTVLPLRTALPGPIGVLRTAAEPVIGDSSTVEFLKDLEKINSHPAGMKMNKLVGEWELIYSDELPKPIRTEMTQHVLDDLADLSVVLSVGESGDTLTTVSFASRGGERKVVSFPNRIVSSASGFVLSDEHEESAPLEVTYLTEPLLVLREERNDEPLHDVLKPDRQDVSAPRAQIWKRITNPVETLGRKGLSHFGSASKVPREEKMRSRTRRITRAAFSQEESVKVVKAPDTEGYGLIKKRRSKFMETVGAMRALFFAFLLFGVAFGVCIVMRVILSHTRRTDPDKRAVMDRLNTIWAKIVTCLFFRVQVVNPENLPALDDTKAYVYIANHQSFMDILSMYFLNRPFKWVSKASIQKIPVIGWAMGMTGHVLLQRDDRRSQIATVRLCIDKLKKGASMFFFPEGTRSKTGQLGAFKKGAFSIAKKANVGMVPITVLGTGDLMPVGRETRLFPSRLGVKLVVHPTITAEEVQDLPDDELVERALQTINSALPPQLRSSSEQEPGA